MSGETGRLIYASGECEIDLARREIRIGGSPVPVGGRAFDVVEVLAQAAGELVSKDDLISRVWPGAVVLENTLQVHAAAIRKALGRHRELLKTESGRGYRLLGNWQPRRRDVMRSPASPLRSGRSLDRPAAGLPMAAASVVGRSAAIHHLRDLMSAYRVVTLTGPGGIGKTTLALQAAHDAADDFDDGATLVELASLADANLVPQAVAQALGLTMTGEDVTPASVARGVGDRQILLMLDNCEHVIDTAAPLAETLVQRCPRLTILATSREILRIEGERTYRVLPLEVPDVGHLEPDHIRGHSAVVLFIARAQAQGADLSLRSEVLPTIAAICRHLDGIPLAIEFAAARAAVLGVEEVALNLRDRFAMLTSGRRTAVPRHRTLRAVLDWSYQLLSEPEQLLLRRLAIFPASFTIEAAAAVVGASSMDMAALRDGIANLVAKSLVGMDNADASPRWRLLETIRAYALQKLSAHDETDQTSLRHAACFCEFFAARQAGNRVPASGGMLAHYARELDNVRAALDWCFSPTGNDAIGVDLTAACAPVWMDLSLMAECCDRCERALQSARTASSANTWPQMWLRIALGSSLVTALGPSDRARTVLTEALAIADSLNDHDMQARALSALASVYSYRGEYGHAIAAVERLRQVAMNIGDPAGVIVAERLLGTTLVTGGRPREAQQCLERVLQSPPTAHDQRRSNWHHSEHRAMARAMLARALWIQGFADKAHAEALASIEDLRPEDHQLSLCRVLYYGICRIAPMTGDFDTAARMTARLTEAATHLNASFWVSAARFLEGKLLVARGELANGLATLRAAFDSCRDTGWRISYPEFTGTLAVALAGVGRVGEALEAVDAAIASTTGSERGQVWYVPELLRIKGEVLLQSDPAQSRGAAQACFREAGTMAVEQAALFWELRIALSVARLLISEGRSAEAGQALAPVFGRFTEGFDSADMRVARVLLDTSQAG